MPCGQRLRRLARRPQQPLELRREHRADRGFAVFPRHRHAVGPVTEARQVELERPIVADVNERSDLPRIPRLAVRREPHHFEFVAVLGKAEVLRDGQVQHAERVGKKHTPVDGDPCPVEHAPRGADEVAESVDRADGGVLEGTHVRGAGQVRRMVLDGRGPAADAGRIEIERGGDDVRQRADLDHVLRAIGDRAARPVPQQEQRLPPQMRPGIAGHRKPVDVGRRGARHPQAFRDRAMRESGAMFDAAEALFLDRGDQPAVAHERG